MQYAEQKFKKITNNIK